MPKRSPDSSTLSVAQARELERARRSQARGEWQIEDRSIASPAGTTALRVYRPTRPAAADQRRGGVVFFHGGGFVVGDAASHDGFCGALSRAGDCVVVSCSYRLAPEHKFPAAVDDAYFATSFIHEHADELEIDHHRLAIAGFEVGASLATTVARLAKERRNPALSSQLLVCPALELRAFDSPSYREREHALARRTMIWAAEHYVRSAEDRLDPRCSPLLARNLIGLPSTRIVSAEHDVLRDDAQAYADLLREVHVDVRLSCHAGVGHGFLDAPDATATSRTALAECVDALTGAWRVH